MNLLIKDSQALSNSNYTAFRDNTLNTTTFGRKTLPMSEIKLLNLSVCEIMGINFSISDTARKSLLKILGLTDQVIGNIQTKLGANATNGLIEMMRTAMLKSEKNNTICVISDKNYNIVDIAKDSNVVLTNGSFFNLFEDVMNTNPGLSIRSMNVNGDGSVNISTVNDKWEFGVGSGKGKLSDEFFKSGLNFENNRRATNISMFNERLVCTNGMIVKNNEFAFSLNKTSAKDMTDFFDRVRNIKNLVHFETAFKNKVELLMNTKASYGEMSKVINVITENSMYSAETRSVIHERIPVTLVKSKYLDHKINLDLLSPADQAKVITPVTVWDLVNELTEISSHPSKFGITANKSNSIFNMQKAAGELVFKEKLDNGVTIPQLFV